MHRLQSVAQPPIAEITPLAGRPLPRVPMMLRFRTARLALLGAALLALFWLPNPVQAQPAEGGGILVQVNAVESRQMSTKKRIKRVVVDRAEVVTVTTRETDPTTAVIVGRSVGTSSVTLIDENDKQEKFDVVVVAFDIVQLRNLLKQVVPSAGVRVLPAGPGSVVVTGTVDRLEQRQQVVDTVRKVTGQEILDYLNVGGVQQVQLDVVVARVGRSELRAMAFNFFASSRNFFIGSTVGQAVANPQLVGVGSSFLNVSGVLSGQPGSPNGLPTNLLIGVLHDRWGFLNFLQALRTEGVVKLMAEPRLVTMSGRQASFLSGGEQAVPVPAGLGQIGVQFEEFGTRLNFVPVVLGNGKIHLEVEPEVSSLSNDNGTSIGGTIVPGRITQRVRTTVELEAGQTFVIGGLIQHDVSGSTIKTPILGDLPFIGAAFNSKVFNETESEMLILVTPHLVDGMDCAQYPKVLPGQETRSPDDFELFLESILEAPRGPREVCHGKTYVPAYKNGPTADLFPCAGNGNGHGNGWRRGKANCPSCLPAAAAPAAGTQSAETAPVRMALPVMHGTMSNEIEPLPKGEPVGTLPTHSPAPVVPASLPLLEEVKGPEMP